MAKWNKDSMKRFFRKKVVYVPVQPPQGDMVLYFSGRTKDYEMADKFIDAIDTWNWNLTSDDLECGVCNAPIFNSFQARALHLVNSHEYNLQGELRSEL